MRKLIFLVMLIIPVSLFSQRVGFINSVMIRENLPESKQADQRIQSIVDEWKREISDYDQQIKNLEFEIKKNRLVWTEYEKSDKEDELKKLMQTRQQFIKEKFEPGAEYDQVVKDITSVVEEKIYAAVQQVAVDKGFDIILDQAEQPVPYANYKYDLTIEVLKLLGVNVEEMQKDLDEKIKKDPRNERKESKRPTRRRSSRSRNSSEREQGTQIEERSFERDPEEEELELVPPPSEQEKENKPE